MEKEKNMKYCEICKELAKCLCLNCNSYFCESCDKYIHQKKINIEHKREEIDLFVPIDTKCPQHPNIPLNLFCVEEKGKLKYFKINVFIFCLYIELCCLLCQFLNPHKDHKLLFINDEQALKKENIDLNQSKEDFDKKNKKINELKEKIEEEILKINNIYDKVFNEVSIYYKKQYEILLKEENELKEKLQNEVTKIKEKLEIFLSECNNSIKINEKLNKGIEKINKEKENRIIKKLSYISKINKTKKNMNTLLLMLMKNLNINFKEENKNIEYEDYYFNGIPVPSDVEIIDITDIGFKLKWKIQKLDALDKNKIKFRVELKIKREKNFEKVYEGNDFNCTIINLKQKTDYELRLCTLYNNVFNKWSEIYGIQTKELQIVFDNESLI